MDGNRNPLGEFLLRTVTSGRVTGVLEGGHGGLMTSSR